MKSIKELAHEIQQNLKAHECSDKCEQCLDETVRQIEDHLLGHSILCREISNLAHYAWTDPKNAEYLFREIEKRAMRMAEGK